MEERAQLIPNAKIVSLLGLIDKEEKIDKDATLMISQFMEKYISDILSRSAIIAKHKEKKLITEDEIQFILEKEFDYFVPLGRN
ncbi:hypothetical protein NEFER03_1251 [Nematocida sp. LUAm3]|nr:hypothetical protein NEFER03_1251 [Nematocida sp. LUAm3]KAI5173853.1 hypothetical protein NEFER02_0320 [Nematocida sp. LUAm2]KAI5177076.1 hypothetical protein NEFER01_0351 [Nematocida sp. LUAm1]